MNSTHERAILKTLSDADFIALGVNDIAYIRKIGDQFGIYGANGEQLALMDDMDHVVATMEVNDLKTVPLQ